MDARIRRCVVVLAGCIVGSAGAADGLRVDPDSVDWPRWQARLGVTTAPDLAVPGATFSLQGARLLGDYYFTGPGFGAGKVTGGFRATSGVFAGTRDGALATPTMPVAAGTRFSFSTRAGLPHATAEMPGDATVPYLGVGYTGMSLRGGWGFTADIGLVGSGVRLGRPLTGASQIDELLRDLRLTPVLQLGVTYSF